MAVLFRPCGDTHLTIPVRTAPGLFSDILPAARGFLHPLDAAGPGDIVGAWIDITAHRARPGTVGEETRYLRRRAARLPGGPRFETVTYRDLDACAARGSAYASMLLRGGLRLKQNASPDTALERLIAAFDRKDSDEFAMELLVTADLAAIRRKPRARTDRGTAPDQEAIDMSFSLLIPDDIASGHDLLRLRQRLAPWPDLLAEIFEARDADGVPIALGLPPLGGLLEAGRA